MLLFDNMLTLGGFANKYLAIPNFSLVNKSDLNKALKAEVSFHTNGQLRVAHLILGYTPLSYNFQEPNNVIKARDHRLHLINVAMLGFLNTDTTPIGVLKVKPLP